MILVLFLVWSRNYLSFQRDNAITQVLSVQCCLRQQKTVPSCDVRAIAVIEISQYVALVSTNFIPNGKSN